MAVPTAIHGRKRRRESSVDLASGEPPRKRVKLMALKPIVPRYQTMKSRKKCDVTRGRHSLQLSDLECVRTIGEGGYGKVLLVRVKSSTARNTARRVGSLFAMKVVTKAWMRLMEKLEDIHSEKRILDNFPWNPFVAGVVGAFHDEKNVYLALEYVPHGTLLSRLHASSDGSLPASTTRFYCSNVICGLAFLHARGVVHCDVKPDNILIGPDGYLVLTDFGLARDRVKEGGFVGFGTGLYMAPEITDESNNKDPPDMNYATALDWWALGCVVFEMLIGKPAFIDMDEDLITANIMKGADGLEWPDDPGLKPDAVDFIKRLLQLHPPSRLGFHGVDEVKLHPWLSEVRWDSILRRTAIAPWVPKERELINTVHGYPLPAPSDIPGLTVVEPSLLYKCLEVVPDI